MPTDVFDNLTYASMEPCTGEKAKLNNKASIRCRQLLRFYEHVKCLAPNEGNKSSIESLLAILEPRLAKASNIASTTTESEDEEPFLDSWRVDDQRHLKGWLTKNFDKWNDDEGKQGEDDQAPDHHGHGNIVIPVTPADVPTEVEAVTALTSEMAISSPEAAQDDVSRHVEANAASLAPAPLNLRRSPPLHAIVTPPPALAPLPAEYYAFARARSQRGQARRRLDEANKDETRARDAFKEGTDAYNGASKASGAGNRSSTISTNSAKVYLHASSEFQKARAKAEEATAAFAEAERRVEAAKAVFVAWVREQRQQGQRE
ncbi:uncharacterized protein LY79DRAFT_673591 [Colletotrichum navitas]|uniref:Uncharacterized protein n=1 Tax=Colletotrichum navitas TaxID=681940 RepID=A0AAD8PP95_9PEZI|nr:uncharacterized protein LY79DRAFT_673591 [Colletotrichum navitas]KAK1573498.1 hypothetical protein LY79DRAFT_673591 [Colletotrichum navitas]